MSGMRVALFKTTGLRVNSEACCFFSEFILYPKHLQDLITIEPAEQQRRTAAAQQYRHDRNDDGSIASLWFLGNNWGQLVVHNDYSYVEIR